jgi:hypothetical protein
MDRDDWEIVFEAFKGTGYPAVRIGNEYQDAVQVS